MTFAIRMWSKPEQHCNLFIFRNVFEKNHLILELYDIRIEAIWEEHSSIDGEL